MVSGAATPSLGQTGRHQLFPLSLTARGASDAQRRSSSGASSQEAAVQTEFKKVKVLGSGAFGTVYKVSLTLLVLDLGVPHPLLWSLSQWGALCVSEGLGNSSIFLRLSRQNLL